MWHQAKINYIRDIFHSFLHKRAHLISDIISNKLASLKVWMTIQLQNEKIIIYNVLNMVQWESTSFPCRGSITLRVSPSQMTILYFVPHFSCFCCYQMDCFSLCWKIHYVLDLFFFFFFFLPFLRTLYPLNVFYLFFIFYFNN